MIHLAVPNLTGNEKKYLDNCIDTTFVSSVGEYVTKFEEMVAAATGSDHAVATSSGTTGLHAALTAAGVTRDDLVIIPTFTFIASANSVAHCGAMPYLMDIDEDTWCISPAAIKKELDKNTRYENGTLIHIPTARRVAAIMPVYTLGNTPDMAAIREIADTYNLPLIVDAACAIGATVKGTPIGKAADLSVMSFNGNKTITCGGGGAVVYNDSDPKSKAWGEKVRHITTTARVWPDYDFDEVGFNYRMTNIQAAVGVAQMERLDEFIDRKRYVRAYYEKNLQALAVKAITFFPTTEGSSCWFSGIVLPEGTELATAKNLCANLKEKDIEARSFWKPVHLQKPYEKVPRGEMTVAEKMWQRIITLPCSTNITEEELGIVRDAVIESFK